MKNPAFVPARLSSTLALTTLALACLLFESTAEELVRPPTVTIVEYGVFELVEEVEERREAPDTAEGSVGVVDPLADPVLVESTDRIEARLGTRFGIRVAATGGAPFDFVPVRIRVVHPSITNPADDTTTEVDEWDSNAQIGFPRYTGWSFDGEHELVSGSWQIQVLMAGKVVAEQAFEVFLE